MPKIFSDDDKQNIKDKMFDAGFSYLKQYGMTHMSVEKITTSAGIGKSTFYNFFTSKEDFVLQLIEYKRHKVLADVYALLNGRSKMSMDEGKALFMSIAFSSNSIFQYLKLEDLIRLQGTPSYLTAPNLEEETNLLTQLLSLMENVRNDIDYPLAANLLKIITLTMEEREMLHEAAYDRTIGSLYQTLFDNIFNGDAL